VNERLGWPRALAHFVRRWQRQNLTKSGSGFQGQPAARKGPNSVNRPTTTPHLDAEARHRVGDDGRRQRFRDHAARQRFERAVLDAIEAVA
jgi:hypothetical protein